MLIQNTKLIMIETSMDQETGNEIYEKKEFIYYEENFYIDRFLNRCIEKYDVDLENDLLTLFQEKMDCRSLLINIGSNLFNDILNKHHINFLYEEICRQIENHNGLLINKKILLVPIHKDILILSERKCNIFSILDIKINYLYILFLKRLQYLKEKGIYDPKNKVNTLKTNFLASISHEIRTPLNGIIGITQLLKDEQFNTNEKFQEYLQILQLSATQLMELLNDIMDYSKLQANYLELVKSSFHLSKCVQDSIDIVKVRIDNKDIHIHLKLDDNLPFYIIGDERRLKQILINILSNSIKYSNQGNIDIHISSKRFQNTVDEFNQSIFHQLNFEIKDQGCGILKEDQYKLFNPFTRFGKSKDKQKTSGSGLGLSITKELIELMDGKITVQSDGMKGTQIYFSIVVEDDNTPTKLIKKNELLFQDKKIVVIDDVMDDRIYLYKIMEKWKLNVICLSTFQEFYAVKDNNEKIDCLFMNSKLFDKYVFTNPTLIDYFENLQNTVPIVGIHCNYCSKYNFLTTCIDKPISKSKLFNILRKIFLRPTSIDIFSSNKLNSFKIPIKEIQIIVAEDDMYNQILFVEFLTIFGIPKSNIDLATNGKECVEKIKNKQYDICFMDIKMPEMDGFEATQIIRRDNKNILIIAVSASVIEKEYNQCYKIGMNYFIEKPIEKDKLYNLLKNIVDY